MKYCEFCCHQLKDNEQCSCEEAVAQRENINHQSEINPEHNTDYRAIFKKHKLPIIIGTAAFVLLFVLIGIFTSASKKDPFDYTEVTFAGYDTNGSISIQFDREQLIEDIIGVEPSDLKDMEVWFEQYEELSDGISYTHNAEEGLSNGDIVTVEFLVMPSCSNKVKPGSKTFTVEGLTEVETVDIFANIEILFSGINGKGNVDIEKTSNDAIINDCYFHCEPEYSLSNGDKVTISITNADEIAETHNVIPKETEKEYEVSGLSSYITDASQIPMDIIKNFADKFLAEEKAEHDEKEYRNFKYCATYLYTSKSTSYDANIIDIYISYDEYSTSSGEFIKTIYTPLRFRKVTISDEGNLNIEYEDGTNSTFTTDLEKSVSKLQEEYNITKLD